MITEKNLEFQKSNLNSGSTPPVVLWSECSGVQEILGVAEFRKLTRSTAQPLSLGPRFQFRHVFFLANLPSC
jgi:hypothetical protein